jgi:hypothetical protein
MNKEIGQEWEVVEKQKVIDKVVNPTLVHDGVYSYKYEYIIKNKETGELRRI